MNNAYNLNLYIGSNYMLIKDTFSFHHRSLLYTSLTKWKQPKSDGGSPLTKYIIEFRDTRRAHWSKAGEVKPEVTTFTVGKLLLNNEYMFRVSAVNAEGQSSPLTSDKTAKPTKKLSKS
jgi:predicted phage tail protein